MIARPCYLCATPPECVPAWHSRPGDPVAVCARCAEVNALPPPASDFNETTPITVALGRGPAPAAYVSLGYYLDGV